METNGSENGLPKPEWQDVVIVGAGLSGIGTAYWLQQKCPQKSFVLLEARDAIGGTWDIFRYPGVRSDSDMFTFGFRFKPWNNPKSLSDGESILSYLKETADENGIRKKIRFGHRLANASWKDYCWTLSVQTNEGLKQIQTRFLYFCSGYYHVNEAHRPQFEGEADFAGTIVHPQFWPPGLDYSGKHVLVVGSGATAVTLVPAMAQTAAQVTMLQRSPTYIMSLPNRDGFYKKLKRILPAKAAYRITRWKNLGLSMMLFQLARRFPRFVARLIRKGVDKQLPAGFDTEKHFSPRYNPWDQRLCFVPDGDFFKAMRAGKASVITDEIIRFTGAGVELKSGRKIDADIVVMATGLKVRLLGGAGLEVNGRQVHTSDVMVYRGMLVSDVPNLAMAFGYTNASWTLKTDLTANYVCRLLNYMDKKGYATVLPRKPAGVQTRPFLDFDAGYIQRAAGILPQQGSARSWRVYQNYFLDMLMTRYSPIADRALEFGVDPKTS